MLISISSADTDTAVVHLFYTFSFLFFFAAFSFYFTLFTDLPCCASRGAARSEAEAWDFLCLFVTYYFIIFFLSLSV